MITTVHVVRIAFIRVGGSLTPAGTRSKYGPVIQRIQTYNWKTRIAPPRTAQIWTGLTFGWTWAPSAAAPPSGSVTVGAFFLSDSPLLMTPSPSGLLSYCAGASQFPRSKGTTVGSSTPSGRTSSPSVLMKPERLVGIGRTGLGQG